MPDKICLGGSFNPIHHAHLLCARAAAEGVGAKNVVLIPTGQAPHKLQQNDTASREDRLAMCQLAIEGVGVSEIDPRETVRPGPSFTIQTIRELKQEGWDQDVWLIGADLLRIAHVARGAASCRRPLLIMAGRDGHSTGIRCHRPFQMLRKRGGGAADRYRATDIRERDGSGAAHRLPQPPSVSDISRWIASCTFDDQSLRHRVRPGRADCRRRSGWPSPRHGARCSRHFRSGWGTPRARVPGRRHDPCGQPRGDQRHAGTSRSLRPNGRDCNSSYP